MAAPASVGVHVVVIPYPGRGHINPMLVLCRQIAARLPPSASVTVVLTEEWLSLIGSTAAAAGSSAIRFRTIPNVLPSEEVRAGDFAGFLEAVYTKMEEPLERLMDGLDAPATAIIADTYLPWTVDVGRRRGIPIFSLFTMSATFFSAILNSAMLPPAREINDELVSKYIRGHGSLRLSDFRPFQVYRRPYELAIEAISRSTKTQCLVFTTAYELEPGIIDSLRSQLDLPVLPVGPIIPHLALESAINLEEENYLSFLDSQPQNSVLYVSLGSFLSVSRSQMDEIAHGLKESGVKFLWVARGESSRIREMITSDGGGIVVPWCDQLRVLCHPSVGGFLTHCGWNSTMEGVFAGVPILTFPIIVDQLANDRMIVDEWGVGVRGKESKGELVGRERVVELVRNLMGLGGEVMRKKVVRLREACRGALLEGGSSSTNLESLIELLIGAKERFELRVLGS